jgi:hypothetical protein
MVQFPQDTPTRSLSFRGAILTRGFLSFGVQLRTIPAVVLQKKRPFLKGKGASQETMKAMLERQNL